MMYTKRSFFYLYLFMIVAGLSACYPIGDDLTYEDLDIAVSMYDKDYYTPSGKNDFQNFQTFVIPDTIIHIIEEGDDDDIGRKYDQEIINHVRANLEFLGYDEEMDPESNAPDIVVTISITVSDHTIYTWYPYWGWYWPYYPKGTTDLPANNYYYPWYPWYGWGSTYSYTSGTIILEMVDISRIDPSEEKVPVIWAGLVNGVVGGPEEGLKVRVSGGIDQCFDQSPYLFKVLK